jgi:hypothetical protein
VSQALPVGATEQFEAWLTEADYERYVLEPPGTTLRLALRQHHLRGENVAQIISDITSADTGPRAALTRRALARQPW